MAPYCSTSDKQDKHQDYNEYITKHTIFKKNKQTVWYFIYCNMKVFVHSRGMFGVTPGFQANVSITAERNMRNHHQQYLGARSLQTAKSNKTRLR